MSRRLSHRRVRLIAGRLRVLMQCDRQQRLTGGTASTKTARCCLRTPATMTGGVFAVIIFMLVARPITVFACALPDRRARWSRNEMLFMCWTRETGVIPAAPAGILLGMKAPGAQMIASVTFIAILMTILIQAPTTRWLGGKLALLEQSKKH
jgi:NhaP-type Na+/H+ or K+/H+ antiporter